jgi:hypothetical protein
MDISSISEHYVLNPVTVTPEQLLLDPGNPRIILDITTTRRFTLKELCTSDVQQYVLSVINKQAHHIAELIRGIESSGFIDKGDEMIVKKIPNTDKYLVIEGNRRTTAIKHLLETGHSLKPVVRATLGRLHVKEFVYRPNREFSEEAVIDILLGTIHINGRLPWGALERAYYIYNSYLREVRRHTSNRKFEYVVDCSREVATLFNLPVRAVRKELIVYRVYEQLKELSYEVMPHHFSLIDMAVTDRDLPIYYFELDTSSFRFSSRGATRFDALCIRTNKAINNPKDFRAFATIFKTGTPHELTLVESNSEPIATILERLEDRLEQREFLQNLAKIERQLEALQPAAFRGVNAEVETILRIKTLVDDRLWRLIKGRR